MSISKNLKKIMVAGAALLMALSAGAGIGNSQANARRRYHYHYTRRYHAKRHYRARHYRRRVRHSVYRSYNPSHYIYHISRNNTPVIKQLEDSTGLSRNQLFHKYAKHGKYVPAFDFDGMFQLPSTVKSTEHYDGASFAQLVRGGAIDKAPLRYMILDGNPGWYTKKQVISVAKLNHLSPAKYLKKYRIKQSKWYDGYGDPTPAAIKIAERDAIGDLNQQRAKAGSGPVTQDPILEFIANKRAQLMSTTQKPTYSWHYDKNGDAFTDKIENKYNIPLYDGSGGENAATVNLSGYYAPSQLAKVENGIWGPGHKANRDGAGYTRAGIGISSSGNIAEEFSGIKPDSNIAKEFR